MSNYQNKYLKYKQKYFNLKNTIQIGGKIKLLNSSNPIIIKSMFNNGVPRNDEKMINQCMFISISDFLKIKNKNVSVAELRVIAGLDSTTEQKDIDLGNSMDVEAIRKITEHFDIRLSIIMKDKKGPENHDDPIRTSYAEKSQVGMFNNDKYLAASVTITPTTIILYRSDNLDVNFTSEILNKTVFIVARAGHFELITKITNNISANNEISNVNNVIYDIRN